MAASFSTDIMMKPSDLHRKKSLDYGGFGEVHLCYHRTMGHVVLKTVYTGPLRDEQKLSLLREGKLMNKLNHKRIVKLLGVILEDGDYSLVLELIPKGNLLLMLQRAFVPVSIQARIILEILEGMVYLSQNQIIHKDLKPENILVDENFHVKIADLGLATCQAWSRLTREEYRRQSYSKTPAVRMAGTLCYMAPEHLQSLNQPSTEKSDVYSFAIVVWVILTSREPYENAINQDQICQCVCQGSRPDESLVPSTAPQEMVSLMKKCWAQEPQNRPTFQESYDSFCPFYKQNLEKDVEVDVGGLMDSYKGPSELVHMTSLTTDQGVSLQALEPLSIDAPATLRTSNSEPVEASQEEVDLLALGALQVDAVRASLAAPPTPPTPATPDNLVQKLDQELNYHKFGSYTSEQFNNHPSPASQPVASQRRGADIVQPVSSVQSWSKASPEWNPAEESSPYNTSYRPDYNSHMSLPFSQQSQYQAKPQFDRMQSCPDTNSDYLGAFPGSYTSDRLSSLCISQSSRIQIGNNNVMHICSQESSSLSSQSSTPTSSKYKELLQKYGDHAITDYHLDLVRDNLASKWKSCARKLGLTDVEIDTIEHDYERDGLVEKVHQMLLRWKMKEGLHGCTVGKLCRGLENSVKTEVLINLLLKSRDNSHCA